MDKNDVSKKLDKAIENFQRDMDLFSQGSEEPSTEGQLYALSRMVLNALGDVKKTFE